MTLREVQTILDARLLTGEESLDKTVNTACGSDLMSDVLAYVKDQALLLTGLVNQQVIRTAEMMDMVCIVFVRGKQPQEQIVEMAAERGMAVLSTDLPMFAACGRLYEQGLRGGEMA